MGKTLTADASGITDRDGLDDASFSYQWLADDAGIDGATGPSYTLAEADKGKAIRVRVSFTDDAGNGEELTSEPTDAVAARPNSPATGAPTIGGTAQVAETLTADVSSIADEDGLDNASFSYQWLADDAEIAGATGSTYTLVEADEGKAVRVRVSFTDDRGNDETLTSEQTAAVAPAPSGEEDPQDGAEEHVSVWSATMTVEWVFYGYGYASKYHKPGSLSPASFKVDGTKYTVTMIETAGWMYIGVDEELPFDFVLEMDGAQFASGDASFNSYSYANIYRWNNAGLNWDDGDTIEVRLFRVVKQELPSNSEATGSPTTSGTARMGETLTADTSGISDSDGLDDATFSYQWLVDDTAISGATNSTYTLADTDRGKTIKVRVSFTDDAGSEETLTSAATAAVTGAEPAERPSTPTGLSGDAYHDRVILSWDDPGDASIDGYMILRRQHDTHTQGQFSTLVEDTGTAETNYTDDTVTPEKRYTYRIKAINEHGESERSRWFHTDTPAEPSTPATGAPTISGTVRVGETLTADTNGIVDEDGLTKDRYTYQWMADDAAINGATGPTYALTDDEEGKAIKVRVSFTDDAGNEEELTSEATGAVVARPNNPATGAPAVIGTAQVGETLTADTSDIADEDGLDNATFSYQWLADDDELAGRPTRPTPRYPQTSARPSRRECPSPTTAATRRRSPAHPRGRC